MGKVDKMFVCVCAIMEFITLNANLKKVEYLSIYSSNFHSLTSRVEVESYTPEM